MARAAVRERERPPTHLICLRAGRGGHTTLPTPARSAVRARPATKEHTRACHEKHTNLTNTHKAAGKPENR